MSITRKLGLRLAVSLASLLSGAPLTPSQINLINLDVGGWSHASPQFMYMWRPSLE